MYTANHANLQSIESCYDEIEAITDEIFKASQDGRNRLELTPLDTIKDGTKLALINAGYEVTEGTGNIKIYWGHYIK